MQKDSQGWGNRLRAERPHLVVAVELVVHEARDDAGLARALVAQEHDFVLGQRRDLRELARASEAGAGC